MRQKEIIVKFSKNETISQSICKALSSTQKECEEKNLHQTIKPSLKQDEFGAINGNEVFVDGEWRNQIGVMLG